MIARRSRTSSNPMMRTTCRRLRGDTNPVVAQISGRPAIGRSHAAFPSSPAARRPGCRRANHVSASPPPAGAAPTVAIHDRSRSPMRHGLSARTRLPQAARGTVGPIGETVAADGAIRSRSCIAVPCSSGEVSEGLLHHFAAEGLVGVELVASRVGFQYHFQFTSDCRRRP